MKSAILSILFCSVFITMSSAQDFEWARGMGGPGYDHIQDMVTDNQGNIYSVGTFEDTADFDPGIGTEYLVTSPNKNGVFIQKLDINGDLVWVKSIPDINYPQDGLSIAIDEAQNLYLTGIFKGTVDFDPSSSATLLTATGNSSVFLLKLDGSGNFIRAQQLEGNSFRCINSIKAFQGGLYLTGRFRDTLDCDPSSAQTLLISAGGEDICIVKLDTSGQFVWAQAIGSPDDETGLDILPMAGGVLVKGLFSAACDFNVGPGTQFLSPSGMFLLKLDHSGDFIWARNLGPLFADGFGNALATDHTGNIYTTGSFDGLVDFDPGTAVDTTTATGSDIFILKMDSSGAYIWSKRFLASGSVARGESLLIDSLDNIHCVGQFQGSCDFDPSQNSYVLTSSAGLFTTFILSLDSAGIFSHAGMIDGLDNFALAATIDPVGNFFCGGFFSGPSDFDPDAAVFQMTPAGSADAFVLKLSSTSSSSLLTSINTALTIYPNPSEGLINIAAKKKIRTLSVTDVLGRTVFQARPDAAYYSVELDVPGVYLLSAEYGDGEKYAQRFVIN